MSKLRQRLDIYRQIIAIADSKHTNKDALIAALEKRLKTLEDK